ncbi:MAG: transposase [Candidatus Omnitrophica bacterium]|nr:transposase [Candidatus Omnitrophota bacterium]
MTRPLRIEYEGAVYHVTARGNAKAPIFDDDKDRLIFCKILSETKKKYNVIYHAYCLMGNHYHLVVETPEANLSKAMRNINGIYTQDYNRKHKRVGHVFQGRYKAVLIDREEYLLEVIRYINLNPVRAGLVKNPKEWEWSSFCGTAGIVSKVDFLDTDWILENFGRDKELAQKQYIEFVKAGIEGKSLVEKISHQNILGNDSFIQKISQYIEGKRDIKEISRNQRYVGRPNLEEIFDEKFRGKEKRNTLIKRAVVEYGYPQKEVARFLGKHYTSISKILNRGKG